MINPNTTASMTRLIGESEAIALGCAGMSLRKGGRGELAAPPPKAYTGLMSDFEIPKPDIC